MGINNRKVEMGINNMESRDGYQQCGKQKWVSTIWKVEMCINNVESQMGKQRWVLVMWKVQMGVNNM